jgi:sulfoxide reductase catalytic subunit YedY
MESSGKHKMLIRKTPDIRPSEITGESVYVNRREFLRLAGLAATVGLVGTACNAEGNSQATTGSELGPLIKSHLSTSEAANSWEDVTTYNNFYEFGTGKADPARHAQEFVTTPWQVTVSGECDKPGRYDLEDILKPHALEERIYRLRCVEAWSMVVPWVGIPLADIIKRFQPNSRAKYVRFKTLLDPERMPGQRPRVLNWPYVEGLSIAEAQGATEPEWCPVETGGALEIRVQEHQVNRRNRVFRASARNQLGNLRTPGIWLFCQRQSGGGSSTLEPGQ